MVTEHSEAAPSPRVPSNVPLDRIIDFNLHGTVPTGQSLPDFWRQAMSRATHGVMWSPHNGGHWLVLDPVLAQTVLTDSSSFSSRVVIVPRDPVGETYSKYIPLSLDPPAHGPFRRLLNDALGPKSIDRMKNSVRELTIRLIEGFRANGRCNFTRDFAEQLPIRVFLQLVDLPESDMPRLKHLADQFTRPDGTISLSDVGRQFSEYIGPVIRDRRGASAADLITRLVNGKVEGRALTHDEAENLCTQVLVGGLDTVVNFLGFVFSYLAEDHETQQAIAENSATLEMLVPEFLHRFPVVSDSREVTKQTEMDGVTMLPRDMVMASTISIALSDPDNTSPLSATQPRQARSLFTFGKGVHTCPGAYLARMELKIVLEEWFSRIPHFRLAEGTAISYTSGIVATVKPFELSWNV
jgi:cytochrome P450